MCRSAVSLICLPVALALGGCSKGAPVIVKSYWGATTQRMPLGSTYDWPDPKKQAEAAAQDEQVYGLVGKFIEADLADLGYVKANGGDTDFLVSYSMGSGVQPTSAGPTTMGLLTIEATAPDGRLIWRGWAEGKVQPSHPPEVRHQTLQKAVRHLVEEFAPG